MAELGIDQNLLQQALQNVKGAEEAVKDAPVAKQIKGMGIGGSGTTELAVAQNLGTDNPLAALLGGALQGKALNKADAADALKTEIQKMSGAAAEQKAQIERAAEADRQAVKVAEQNVDLVASNLNNAAAAFENNPALASKLATDALIASGRTPVGSVAFDPRTGNVSGTFMVNDGNGEQRQVSMTFPATNLVDDPSLKQRLSLALAGGNEAALQAQQKIGAFEQAQSAGQTPDVAAAAAGLGRIESSGEQAFRGTTQAQKAAEEAQIGLERVRNLVQEISDLPEDSFGAKGQVAQGAIGLSNLVRGVASLIPNGENIVSPVTSVLENKEIKERALNTNELDTLTKGLSYTAGAIYGQVGKALSREDQKIFQEMTGNPTSFFKNKESTMRAMEVLLRGAELAAQTQTGIAVEGINPNAVTPTPTTREQLLNKYR